jgi:hypothetical protein
MNESITLESSLQVIQNVFRKNSQKEEMCITHQSKDKSRDLAFVKAHLLTTLREAF